MVALPLCSRAAMPKLPAEAQAKARAEAQAQAQESDARDYAFSAQPSTEGAGEQRIWNNPAVVYADPYRIVTMEEGWTEDLGAVLHLWDASTLRYTASIRAFFWHDTWGQDLQDYAAQPTGDGNKCVMGGNREVFSMAYVAGGSHSIAGDVDKFIEVDALDFKGGQFTCRQKQPREATLEEGLASLSPADLGGMAPQAFRESAAAMVIAGTPLDCNLFPEVAPLTLALRPAGSVSMEQLNPDTLSFDRKPAVAVSDDTAAVMEALKRVGEEAYMSKCNGAVHCGTHNSRWVPFCECIFAMDGAFDTLYFLSDGQGEVYRLTSPEAWNAELQNVAVEPSESEKAAGRRRLVALDEPVADATSTHSGKQAPTLNYVGGEGNELFWLVSCYDECRLYRLDMANKTGRMVKKWSGVFQAEMPVSSPSGLPDMYTMHQGQVSMPAIRPVYLPELHLVCLPVNGTKWSLYRLDEKTLETTHVCDAILRNANEFAFILPDGRYAGSPGCEGFLTYTRNGRTVGMAPFAPWLNRPADVVRALSGNEQAAAILAATTERWLKKLGRGAGDDMPSIDSLPAVSLQIPPLWTESESLRLSLESAGAVPAAAYAVSVNGAELPKLAAGGTATPLELPLEPGQNWVEVTPETASGVQGDTVKFRVLRKGERAPERYIVCLGVSEYAKVDANLKCAAKDAADIAKAFSAGMGGKAHILLLQDGRVTHETPADVAGFLKNARPEDEVILFCAGHGVRDEGLTYYFCGSDFEPEKPAATGISYERLLAAVRQCPARHRLVLMDTCHAGVVGEEDEEKLARNGALLPGRDAPLATRGMRVRKAEITDSERAALAASQAAEKRYIESLFRLPGESRGVNVVTAVSGSQLAMEDPASGNGLFTAGILKALASENSDMNADGVLSLDELTDSLRASVPEHAVALLRSACAARGLDYETEKGSLPEPMTPSLVAYESSQNFALKTFTRKEARPMQRKLQAAAPGVGETASPAAAGDNGAEAQLARVRGLTMRTKLETSYQKRVIELLEMIAAGADVDTRLDAARNNTTCLHNAAAICDLELVQWLVEQGADINARAKNKARPLDCVGEDKAKAPQVRKWIKAHGGKAGL